MAEMLNSSNVVVGSKRLVDTTKPAVKMHCTLWQLNADGTDTQVAESTTDWNPDVHLLVTAQLTDGAVYEFRLAQLDEDGNEFHTSVTYRLSYPTGMKDYPVILSIGSMNFSPVPDPEPAGAVSSPAPAPVADIPPAAREALTTADAVAAAALDKPVS